MIETKMTRGRPRDQNLNERVLDVVWDLLQTRSVQSLSLSEIARVAYTNRPALYRRWKNVEEIVIDAFMKATEDQVPTPKSNYPALALREYITALAGFFTGPVARTIAEILGAAQTDPFLLDLFHTRFLSIRRNHGRAVILKGQREGIFRTDINSDLAIDLYAGPIYFRAIARHAEINDQFVKELSDRVICAISSQS